jgi:hypothetical protein
MSEQGDCVNNADGRLPPATSSTITEFLGTPAATVHCRIVFACVADAIEQKLERISRTLQKEGASDISIAVSINPANFSPTATVPTNASWMVPSSDADE